LTVFEGSPSTEALVDQVESRWGRLDSQLKTEDLADVPIAASRELRRARDYVPSFRPVPRKVHIEVELDADQHELIGGLIATGVYGATEGEAIRAAFMRWCNSTRTRIRRPLVSFTGA
jgi:hypothetical protein